MTSADTATDERTRALHGDPLRTARVAAERLAARRRASEELLDRASALLADSHARCMASRTVRGGRGR